MSTVIDSKDIKQVFYGTDEVKQMKLNSDYVWCKPYKFNLTVYAGPTTFAKGNEPVEYTLYRTTTYSPLGLANRLFTVDDPIYHGDNFTLNFKGVTNSQFTLAGVYGLNHTSPTASRHYSGTIYGDKSASISLTPKQYALTYDIDDGVESCLVERIEMPYKKSSVTTMFKDGTSYATAVYYGDKIRTSCKLKTGKVIYESANMNSYTGSYTTFTISSDRTIKMKTKWEAPDCEWESPFFTFVGDNCSDQDCSDGYIYVKFHVYNCPTEYMKIYFDCGLTDGKSFTAQCIIQYHGEDDYEFDVGVTGVTESNYSEFIQADFTGVDFEVSACDDAAGNNYGVCWSYDY